MDTKKVEEMVKGFVVFSDEVKEFLGMIAQGQCFIGGSRGVEGFLDNIDRCPALSRRNFRTMQADEPFLSMQMGYDSFHTFFNSDEFQEWRSRFDRAIEE